MEKSSNRMKMKKTFVLIVSILFLAWSGGFAQTTVSDVYITGNFTVGSTLTGYYSTSGGGSNNLSLAWYRVSPREFIAGATNSYTIQAADLGKNLYFRVMVLKSGTGDTLSRDSSAVSIAVIANVKPVASTVKILGTLHSGLTVYGAYNYSDLENDTEGNSTFRWEVADDVAGTNAHTVSASSNSYTIADADTGKHLRFSVTPVAFTGTPGGTEASSFWSISPVVNDVPVSDQPTILYTLKNVNSVLTGHYSYSDTEGDIEQGSKYQWYSSPTYSGTYDPILYDTLSSHVILMTEQGRYFKFSVTPGAFSGSSPGVLKQSISCGPANKKPSAGSLTIFGNTTNGSTLKARFNYADVDGDPKGNCIFQWYRGTTPVAGATDSAYLLGPDDVGLRIKFDVTPVSSSGFPDTGDKITSSLSNTITDPSAIAPGAKDICLAGYRSAQSVLTGKYTYVKNGYNEEDSECLWLSGNDVIKSSIKDPDNDDTLKLRAIYIDTKIRFAVIPRNKNGVKGDTVFSLPLSIFTMPRESFTIADPDIPLSASPAGGFFTGTGVINNILFSPKSVNFNNSPFSITYQLTIDTGSHTCVQKAYTKLSVSGVNMAFESIEDRYCQNHGLDIIYVRKMPKGYTGTFFLNDTIGTYLKVNDTTLIIDPSKMSSGYKELKFSADSTGGKHLDIPPRPFLIDAVPVVSIKNLPADTVMCNNIVPFKLFASHEPAVFAGPVNGEFMDPSNTVGNAVVNYTHTTDNGCVTAVSVPIKINPSPVVSFAAKDYCIESDNDITMFLNKTLPLSNPLNPADSVNKWYWAFYNAGGIDTSTLKKPGYLYKTEGIKKVVLTATTVNGCTSVKDSTIDLGVKPEADFYWTKECFHTNDSIILKDTTTSESSIASRTWIFNQSIAKDRIPADKSQGYLKVDSGYINVRYIVRTNYVGCHDTVDKNVYIRPTVSLKTNDYFEDFEQGKKGWVKDYEQHNTWSFGKPSRKVIQNAVPPGVNAWVTGFLTDTLEHSSVISPCFDFKDIQRPMIKMKLWRSFDLNRDGAALQYKIGDDPSGWQYVGTLDDGINWYNSTLIKGRPGGDQIGWTAGSDNQKDSDWIESRHKLDELMGKEDVKFRIVYGSDGTARENDGLAFDDIWIGRRTRGVLLEHYTNNSMSAEANKATTKVSTLAVSDTVDIINIQYHTNFPGSGDPYYTDNPGDASARILYYGLSRVPYSFIDGGTGKNFANIFDYRPTPSDSPLDENDLKRRVLINPYFLITLNTDVDANGVLTVSGQIKAVATITNSENVTLYLAVTEKKSKGPKAVSGDSVFYNVLRKFLPDAGGITLKKSWAIDDIYTITERSWKIENVPNGSDIEVIAFIQNNITKEIYQAESNREHNVPVAIDNLFANKGIGFSIYPNPASDRLTIEFENSLQNDADIVIYDFRGTPVRTYKAASGQSEYTISGMGLRGGIYLVKIKSGGTDRGFKKLVVSDN
jgi:hypothetical protein